MKMMAWAYSEGVCVDYLRYDTDGTVSKTWWHPGARPADVFASWIAKGYRIIFSEVVP